MNDTQTLTLSEFLLARIGEDEAVAHNALGLLGIETDWHTVEQLRGRGLTRADARHVAAWSSRRVLAECEAKRRIVGQHHEMLTWCQGCAHESYPCRTITALALPYSDHPDFDPAWR